MYSKKTYAFFAFISALWIIVLSANLMAQTTKQEEIDLNDFMGARLYKVFNTFGTPSDVYCSADGKGEVILDYGIFALQIGNKTVTIVYFWSNFTSTVFGLKMGMPKDDIIKTLGKPGDIKTSAADNNEILIYKLSDTDRMLIIFLDKNNKIYRMQIEWLS